MTQLHVHNNIIGKA